MLEFDDWVALRGFDAYLTILPHFRAEIRHIGSFYSVWISDEEQVCHSSVLDGGLVPVHGLEPFLKTRCVTPAF